MNTANVRNMSKKMTLSTLIKAKKLFNKNIPEKAIERIEISIKTFSALKMVKTSPLNSFFGIPFYIIPGLKVPYRIVYVYAEENER